MIISNHWQGGYETGNDGRALPLAGSHANSTYKVPQV